MTDFHWSRRQFLQGTGTLAGSSLARIGLPALGTLTQAACSARDQGASFKILSKPEATEIAAIAARIIPTTDTAGATEAGVIHFIDQSFASFMQDDLERLRKALADLQSGIADVFPGAEKFSDLSEEDQDRHLAAHEDADYFGEIRFLTLAGFFTMSSYGGNKDHVGWKLIGLPADHGGYQPPFGYYDAEYMQGEQDGE